jgi:hypothetical protein
MKRTRPSTGLLALVVLIGAALACNTAGRTSVTSTPIAELPSQTVPTPAVLATKTQPIGPEGGVIALDSGARLVFPAGAVGKEMDVQVNQLDPSRYLDEQSEGMLLDLSAPVTTFKKQIELHIPLPGWFTPDDSDTVVAGTVDETTGAIVYEPAVVRVTGNGPELVVEADHFSWRLFKWWKENYGLPPSQGGPLEVPYYSQGSTSYCWAASLQMVAEAVRHSQIREIFSIMGAAGIDEGGLGPLGAANYPSISGLMSAHTGAYPERNYWPSEFLISNNDTLITYIRRQVGIMGHPVALISAANEHACVVVGYEGKDFYVHDPAGLPGYIYRRVSAADLGLDTFAYPKATIVVPLPLADDRPLVTVNIMDASLEFLKPKTNTPADTYQFRWDYTSPNGYRFRNRSDQAVAAIPGEVTQLRLVGNGPGIEIANAYRSGGAKDVSVWIDITGKGPGKTHYSERTMVSVEPGKVQKVQFNPINVDDFRDPAPTPTEYTFRVSALVGGQVVDDASFTFLMGPGGTPTPTSTFAATPKPRSTATPSPTKKAACPSGSQGQATTKSDSFGNPGDTFLSYTISGADFSQDPPGDFRLDGYYAGGPINLSGKMIVDRTNGMLSYVTMHARLGDQSAHWPPPGQDSAVKGRIVSMPYNLSFTVPKDHDCSPITGDVRLEVCGGVCGVYDVGFVIYFAVPPTVTPGAPPRTLTPTPTRTPIRTATPTRTPSPTRSPAPSTAPGAKRTATPQPGAVEEIFKITSVHAAYNGATTPTTFTVGIAWTVTEIRTYHWNNGRGAKPGTISLRTNDGTIYGPWQATGEPGSGGASNAYWVVKPDVIIGPGTYTVLDSDPSTWSQNQETSGRGMAWGYGIRRN